MHRKIYFHKFTVSDFNHFSLFQFYILLVFSKVNIKICEKQILNSIGLPAISYKSNLVRYICIQNFCNFLTLILQLCQCQLSECIFNPSYFVKIVIVTVTGGGKRQPWSLIQFFSNKHNKLYKFDSASVHSYLT